MRSAVLSCLAVPASLFCSLAAASSAQADVYGRMLVSFETWPVGSYVKLVFDGGTYWVVEGGASTHIPKIDIEEKSNIRYKQLVVGYVNKRVMIDRAVVYVRGRRREAPAQVYASKGMEVRIFQRQGDFYGVSYPNGSYPGRFATGLIPVGDIDAPGIRSAATTEEKVPPVPAQR